MHLKKVSLEILKRFVIAFEIGRDGNEGGLHRGNDGDGGEL